MKTLIASLALSASLAFTNPAASFGNNGPGNQPTTVATYKTGIYPLTGGRLNIALDKETGGPVDIHLKDSNGNVLYRQHLGKHERTYRVRLNLSDLSDGTYQLEITNGVNTTQQTVTLTTQPSVTSTQIILSEPLPGQL